ncbi:MAG: hypothetical protein HKL80_07715 [Acidimicrobiales bacterium]|nr:hypothetical protein [Acidimicrobiales bacterium]
MQEPLDSAYYEELRGKTRAILIEVADLISGAQAGLIDELIDANESGVALEEMISIIKELKLNLDPSLIEQIIRLADFMKLRIDTSHLVGLEIE